MYDLQFPDPILTTFMMFRQAGHATYQLGESQLIEKGLTIEKLAILWACRDYPMPLTLTELSQLIYRRKATVSELLNRMEKDGLISRVPRRKKAPSKEIVITPEGLQACYIGIEALKVTYMELISALSVEQQQQLHDILHTLRDKALQQLNMVANDPPVVPLQGATIPLKW